MKKIFSKPAELEKLSKEKFSIPPFLMMENAARAMADFILTLEVPEHFRLLIVCGKGNNGGDGLALARMLQDKAEITVVCETIPTTQEGEAQYKMCSLLGIRILKELPDTDSAELSADIIADCLYGIGFHGELSPAAKNLLDKLNNMTGIKIACDIPSGLYFNADYTITMGEHKTVLFSDKAKAVCGKILVADLGISKTIFESRLPADAFLMEETDLELPVRTNKTANKGSYGHTTVFAGNKAGAGIIAATAAMKFGSGLTTLYKTSCSNIEQFKIPPELMLSDSIPDKTTAVVAGPGLGQDSDEAVKILLQWLKTTKHPSAVFDADLLTRKDIASILAETNNIQNAQIIITPHLSELSRLLMAIKAANTDFDFSEEELAVPSLAENSELKIRIGKKLNELYPNVTVVMKSANTFLADKGEVFICTDGCQSLAKGGSGDVLAGLAGALLAQGYTGQKAAITAVEAHALAAKKTGAQNFDLTPEKLINALSDL